MTGTSLVLTYQFTTTAPLLLHDAAAGRGPLVPGSTLKGAARHSAEAAAAAVGLPPCRADGDSRCLLCRLFGAAGSAGSVHWTAATPTEDSASGPALAALVEVRRRRPVHRAFQTSGSADAFARTVLPPGLRFAGLVRGWLGADAEAEAALLTVALQRLARLGGGRAAGYGQVSVDVLTVHLAGEERAAAALLASLWQLEAV